ncbi:MAG: 2-oxo acid dehydrogenase subunit E2, partial [Chloroflexi bacterium]|nr:2-oxo acid dehydrogenase subunit E2 [Chloroflexota bacterium]
TINMPKLGFDMQEGMLVRWLKQVGEPVEKGEVIAEIETDKATVEVEAQASGTVLKLMVGENTVVEVGSPIAVVGAEGEEVEEGTAPAKGDGGQAAETEDVATEQPARQPAAGQHQRESAPSGNGYPEGVKASPVARRIARERDIDLHQVQGSGPGGRIVKRDVEGFEPGTEAPAAPATTTAPTYEVPAGADIAEVELSRMRKIVGQRTQQSFQFVPHFYVTSEIDMAAALVLRKEINALIPESDKVSVNDMIVKAVALTLRSFPNLNTHFHGDKLIRHQRINIGIAVALENGLINVVCKDADRRPLSDMAVNNKRMIAAAREGRIKPEDVDGATFTVSNLGPYDVEHFLAIINPPEAGILAVGSAREVPVVVDGQITVGVRMKATISIDHRVSDGAEGAQFMQQLKALLESPMKLLV